MCERGTGLSSLFTMGSLRDQLAHRLSPLTGSTVRKGSCLNLLESVSDLNEVP